MRPEAPKTARETLPAGHGALRAAIEQARRSLELDPVVALVGSNAAFAYYHAGHYGEALASCRRALEMDSGFWAHYDLGRIHVELGEQRAGDRRARLGLGIPPEWASRFESALSRGRARHGMSGGLAGDQPDHLMRLPPHVGGADGSRYEQQARRAMLRPPTSSSSPN